MQKRSDRHRLKKTPFHRRLVLIIVFCFTASLGSMTVLAADSEGNISSVLKDWFTKQETEAIDDIDTSVTKVQDEQTERLKKKLHDMLEEEKEDVDALIESEKQERTDALEDYADELIADFKEEHSEADNFDDLPTSELDGIIDTAEEEMDEAVQESDVKETSDEASDEAAEDTSEENGDDKSEKTDGESASE